MRLGDKVHVVLEVTGEVVGRTFEQDPKIDLKTPWGMLNGLPISVLKASRPAEAVDEEAAGEEAVVAVPANVTQIAAAVRKNRRPTRKAG